jgi:hypothetical protein
MGEQEQQVHIMADAQRFLEQLVPITTSHTAEHAELLASGVSRQRIDALYSFDLNNHVAKMLDILNDVELFDRLYPVLSRLDMIYALGNLQGEVRTAAAQALARQQPLQEAINQLRAEHSHVNAGEILRQWAYLLLYLHCLTLLPTGTTYPRSSVAGGLFEKHREPVQQIIDCFETA